MSDWLSRALTSALLRVPTGCMVMGESRKKVTSNAL